MLESCGIACRGFETSLAILILAHAENDRPSPEATLFGADFHSVSSRCQNQGVKKALFPGFVRFWGPRGWPCWPPPPATCVPPAAVTKIRNPLTTATK